MAQSITGAPSIGENAKFSCSENSFYIILRSLFFLIAVVSEVTIEGAPEKFAVVGNELRLTCRYSFDVSEVQWLKNDIVISSNDTMENNTRGNITHFNESSIQLTISPIISSDAANYTCVVFDFVDNSSDTIAIRGLYQVRTFSISCSVIFAKDCKWRLSPPV